MSSRKPKSTRTSRRRLVFDDKDSSGDEDGNNNKKQTTRTNAASAAAAATPDVQIVPPPSSPAKRVMKPKKKRKSQLDVIFDSPEAKRARVVPAAVTPEERAAAQLSKYVPKYVHNNVEYLRKGEAKLPPNTIKVYQWICRHFVIPKDFEQKRLYGPLSGTNYEERVIQAYSLGKLERSRVRDNDDGSSIICTVCAEEGHQRDDCPTLL